MDIITLFSQKGGVGKTTSVTNLAYSLNTRGIRTLLVDADPQCTLTYLLTSSKGESLENVFNDESNTIFGGLSPAFQSSMRSVTPVDCIKIEKNLFLLPGHINLFEYESILSMAQNSFLPTLKNIPGAFRYLIEITAKQVNADVVLIDLSPNLGSINQNIIMTSDYFIIPTNLDELTTRAISSIQHVLKKWVYSAERIRTAEIFKDSVYPFPIENPKFLGLIISQTKTYVDNSYILNKLTQYLNEDFYTGLKKIKMTLPHEKYAYINDFLLAQIPHSRALTRNHADQGEQLTDLYFQLTEKIIRMISHE
ncbi:ParA family protein [Paenibacillus sp. HW567]|uniref:ParA family protein n=1 Tax=Paenibacillus sp. HW567 TaxID=1034769 RepID=UPI000369A3DC|nr:AAA family ATPase [Paenibacillus sp. HW567]